MMYYYTYIAGDGGGVSTWGGGDEDKKDYVSDLVYPGIPTGPIYVYPDTGYVFWKWDDESTANPRKDTPPSETPENPVYYYFTALFFKGTEEELAEWEDANKPQEGVEVIGTVMGIKSVNIARVYPRKDFSLLELEGSGFTPS